MPPRTTKELMYEAEHMLQQSRERALAEEDPTQFSRQVFINLFLDSDKVFAEERTPEEIALGERYDQAVAEARIASLPAMIRAKEIGVRITAKEAAKVALAADQDDPEDAWNSMGGGNNTYHQQGFVPIGRVEDTRTQVTRGRGGKLVTRVTLAGKFIDVPVGENSSNIHDLEAAKVRLVHGQGTPTRRLRRKANRENQQVS